MMPENLTYRDFRNFDIGEISEKGVWSHSYELDLLKFLDEVHLSGKKFALSNIIRSKGKENKFLSEWLNKNSDIYHVVHLNHSYANSNYHRGDKSVTENL